MKVLVATPVMRRTEDEAHGGGLYLRALLSWYRMDWHGQLDYFQMVGGDDAKRLYDNVVRKYNEAREMVLSNGYDALMTIESDTIVPEDALLKLAAVDADVAYGLYTWRNGFPYWNAYIELDEAHGLPISLTEEGRRDAWGKVIETKGVGNGCTLIHRHVLEELEFTWSEGEFGCCDWHLAVDCQKMGFKQAHDMSVVCGHIAVNPVHRILWPDPEAKGGYRMDLLENWPELEPDEKIDERPLTGRDVGLPQAEDHIQVEFKKQVHMGGGVYRSPGEVANLPVEQALVLLKARLVKRTGGGNGDGDPAGFVPKEPCGDCPERMPVTR